MHTVTCLRKNRHSLNTILNARITDLIKRLAKLHLKRQGMIWHEFNQNYFRKTPSICEAKRKNKQIINL
uniref:Uncharacterized protein n=1 Tax=Candidatus Kentrum sp. TUN TaxID=2126343 RepID=A0A450ZE87_9GAMM|nr:MAG: hypothetical protein BECKTUN1418E_GA0071001_10076 [Candidatus Kentron sp. TUN]VFK52093.1 MAG: hypothetical protein BECKTUN1418F_GA0071002_10055 [Candidatus Kentron sp. TUN]